MQDTETTLPSTYFDAMYDANPDPWRISEGWYEHRKRALALAMLPRPRYGLALEPGCGNGELTQLLAARCDRVLAWDGAAAAVRTARERLAHLPNVEVQEGSVPAKWPEVHADLVVLSEIGYYLSSHDLDATIGRAVDGLVSGGALLAIHWRRESADYPLGGDDVHAHLFGRSGLERLGGYADEDVRIEVFVKTPPDPKSVAQQTGVA